jgi:hypothetical protein
MMGRAAPLVVCIMLGLAACGRVVPVAPPDTGTAERPATAMPASLQTGRAVLVRGTARTSGVPGFGHNALPALSGAYLYQRAGLSAAGQPDSVAVWYTTVPLLIAPPWSAATCPGMPAEYRTYTAPSAQEGATLWLLSSARFALVIAMPPQVTEPCRFLSVFAERFEFFLRYSERPEDISFPATLDTGR